VLTPFHSKNAFPSEIPLLPVIFSLNGANSAPFVQFFHISRKKWPNSMRLKLFAEGSVFTGFSAGYIQLLLA
jgi:hypothetical protein